ncbi:hypothetical protein FKP32DRAFT_1606923 [Trametes sanguinea]|nr:hypothetical protein FKP32DRAFT_1606923 [Trametes sanguinea]
MTMLFAAPPPYVKNWLSGRTTPKARQRAKRNQYIQQLDHTIAKLRALLDDPPFQSSIPDSPHLQRIRELEQENKTLTAEVEELRRQLEMRSAQLRERLNVRVHAQDSLPALDSHSRYSSGSLEFESRRMTDSNYLAKLSQHVNSLRSQS